MPQRPNLYALLGILRSATQEEIRRAYMKAAKKLHPDKNELPGETELFLGVQDAYQVLSDPSRRSAYDATLPPEIESAPLDSPLHLNILLSRPSVLPLDEPQMVYALLTFGLSKDAQRDFGTPPLNLCLTIDCSTSMKGEKLDTVKQTAIQIIRQLRPQDIFSVVTFSDKAEVLIPATRNLDIRRAEIKIQMLQTNGGTEILHGLESAYQEVQQYASPKLINHIILLTDGRTYGDEDACYTLAEHALQNNINISGFGIGHQWNDIFLDHLTQISGGSATFVAQPDEIEALLQKKFHQLGRVFAENITFERSPLPGVEIAYAFRLNPDPSPLLASEAMQLGPILRDEALSVLFEMRLQPGDLKKSTFSLLQGKLLSESAATLTPLLPHPLHIQVRVEKKPANEMPPPAIVQALSKLTLYRIQEKAHTDISSGNYEAATQRLKTLATRLLSQGQRGLARTVLLEVENIEQQNQLSADGAKRIKYGTRSLLMPGEIK